MTVLYFLGCLSFLGTRYQAILQFPLYRRKKKYLLIFLQRSMMPVIREATYVLHRFVLIDVCLFIFVLSAVV